MPCVFLETSHFKEILASLPELPPHNWLITDLDCCDYCGWDGCEKWAERELFLTDEELLHDINLRNMQMIWGVFSAIPPNTPKRISTNIPSPKQRIPVMEPIQSFRSIPWPFWSCTPMTAVLLMSVPMMPPC